MVTPNQYTQRPGLLLFSTGWAIHPSEFILPLSRFIYSKERGRKSVDPSMVYPLFGGRSSNRCRKEKLFFFSFCLTESIFREVEIKVMPKPSLSLLHHADSYKILSQTGSLTCQLPSHGRFHSLSLCSSPDCCRRRLSLLTQFGWVTELFTDPHSARG